MSDATVKTHVARILSKLSLRDRIQAVVLAYETGFVQPGGVRGMRRVTEDDLTLEDATGERYPPRVIGARLLDTLVRTLLLTGALYAIGLSWEAFA